MLKIKRCAYVRLRTRAKARRPKIDAAPCGETRYRYFLEKFGGEVPASIAET